MQAKHNFSIGVGEYWHANFDVDMKINDERFSFLTTSLGKQDKFLHSEVVKKESLSSSHVHRSNWEISTLNFDVASKITHRFYTMFSHSSICWREIVHVHVPAVFVAYLLIIKPRLDDVLHFVTSNGVQLYIPQHISVIAIHTYMKLYLLQRSQILGEPHPVPA